MGSFSQQQQQQQPMTPSYRRTRQHAATISDPMVSPSGLHRLQQQQQAPPSQQAPPNQPSQQGFRYYNQQPQQQPQQSQQQQQHRLGPPPPRRLSFVGMPLSHEQYETSFSRSTSTAQAYGQSPQSQFSPAYASSRQMFPPPPASAPAHQLHFSPYGGARGPPPPPPIKRSLSPVSRRHAPGSGQQQRSPLPFPRIPSPSQSSQAAVPKASQSPARESSRRLSSVVWGPTGFERLESGMSRCRMCAKEYSKGSSTGTLKRHYRQHQVNVAAGGSGSSAANPYARPSSPPAAPHMASRPRAYSHRTDMRTRREMSPPSFSAQLPPFAMPPASASAAPGRAAAAELDTSSAIAGSALLSMAAGGGGAASEARRPMRSSDPSVYAQPASGGGDSGS
ncbi:hypothetical protein GGI21_005834, partial [Coemansia aciculifera]